MLLINDIFAFIEVDGQALEEHAVEVSPDTENTISCWIATQPDKNFSIVWGDGLLYRHDTLTSSIEVDGSRHGGRIISPTSLRKKATQAGITTSATSWRPYVFSRLQLTDEDEYLDKASKYMGEIRVEVWRVQVRGYQAVGYRAVGDTISKVHERSKKALSHCVGYGPEVTMHPTSFADVAWLDSRPLATFLFRYREYDILRANGIIPRPVEQQRMAPPAEVLDLTAADVKEECRVKEEAENPTDIESLDAAIRALKRKRAALAAGSSAGGSTSQLPAKRIKRESTRFVPKGEVIDLT